MTSITRYDLLVDRIDEDLRKLIELFNQSKEDSLRINLEPDFLRVHLTKEEEDVINVALFTEIDGTVEEYIRMIKNLPDREAVLSTGKERLDIDLKQYQDDQALATLIKDNINTGMVFSIIFRHRILSDRQILLKDGKVVIRLVYSYDAHQNKTISEWLLFLMESILGILRFRNESITRQVLSTKRYLDNHLIDGPGQIVNAYLFD